MKNSDLYLTWRDMLLFIVAEKISRPCVVDKKLKYKFDYGNPLSCDCRCEQVERILNNVKAIIVNQAKGE